MEIKKKNINITPLILAAGKGSRMGFLTKNLPKSLLKINSKIRLVDKIIENFCKLKFEKPYLICGFQSKKFKNLKNINLIYNKNWKNTNIYGSLICADKILSKKNCIVSYADIFYEKKALDILKKNKKKNCIVLLSYKFWKKYWTERFKNPLLDLESFKFKKKKLIEIGKRENALSNIQGQYMGLFKIDPVAWHKIKKYIFNNHNNFEQLDITSLFNIVIEKKICSIFVEEYRGKWFEIDNIKDYKILKKTFEK